MSRADAIVDTYARYFSRARLMQRYLDPATSLGEMLFGLIMTLTFTLGAGIIIEDEGREGARQLLIAVIGCNIAWGIIDGALYLVGPAVRSRQLRRLGLAVRRRRCAPASARRRRAGRIARGRHERRRSVRRCTGGSWTNVRDGRPRATP